MAPVAPGAREREAAWLRAARRARWLSCVSLVWMLAEGVLGIIAGVEAHSIGVIAWAIGSAVEAAAAVIVIVRLTGANRFSVTAEQRAQKWVAGSFFVLVPYILYEATTKLINGRQLERNWLAVALLASSILLMPTLGWAKHRLGERLGFAATAGEGTQNLLCAVQAAVGLVGMLLGSAGAGFRDPTAAHHRCDRRPGRCRAVARGRLRLSHDAPTRAGARLPRGRAWRVLLNLPGAQRDPTRFHVAGSGLPRRRVVRLTTSKPCSTRMTISCWTLWRVLRLCERKPAVPVSTCPLRDEWHGVCGDRRRSRSHMPKCKRGSYLNGSSRPGVHAPPKASARAAAHAPYRSMTVDGAGHSPACSRLSASPPRRRACVRDQSYEDGAAL